MGEARTGRPNRGWSRLPPATWTLPTTARLFCRARLDYQPLFGGRPCSKQTTRVRVPCVCRVCLRSQPTDGFIFPLYNRAGDRFEILLSTTPRRDDSGRITGTHAPGVASERASCSLVTQPLRTPPTSDGATSAPSFASGAGVFGLGQDISILTTRQRQLMQARSSRSLRVHVAPSPLHAASTAHGVVPPRKTRDCNPATPKNTAHEIAICAHPR